MSFEKSVDKLNETVRMQYAITLAACAFTGMQAENNIRSIAGDSPAYGEDAFATIASELVERVAEIFSTTDNSEVNHER